MNSTFVTLVFDFGLAILLMVTIGYCAKLSRRIKIIQDGRSEFASMLTQFDMSTNRAMASVEELQTISKKITDALQLKIDKANFLADDLAFLIEKSNKLVIQLEQLKMSSEKKIAPKNDRETYSQTESILKMMAESKGQAQEEKIVPRTNAERELLAALKGR